MEDKNKKSTKGTKKKIIIFVIVIIAIFAVSAFFLINKDTIFSDNKSYNTGAKINLDKCLNDSEGKYSNLDEKGNASGLYLSYNNGDVYLNINEDKFTSVKIPKRSYLIDGIKKNEIKSYFIDSFSLDSSGITVLFLTNNSNIKYFKVFSDSTGVLNITNDKFYTRSMSKLPEIIKLYGANVTYNNLGNHTIIAATKNGSFYNLSKLITKTNEVSVNLKNSLNDNNHEFSDLKKDTNDYGVNVIYDTEKVMIQIDGNKLLGNGEAKKYYTVDGIDKNEIKEIYISSFGLDYTGITVLFATNDGIKYVKIFNNGNLNLINNTFSVTTIKDFNDAVTLYTVSEKQLGETTTGSSFTIIAVKEDGSFYNLDDIINKTATVNPDTVKDVDLNKCLNDDSMVFSDLMDDSKSDYGVSVVRDANKEILVIDNEKLLGGQGKSYHDISGITPDEVKETYVSSFGLDYTGMVVFFITNNGDVKYVKLFNKGSLASVFNAVKIDGIGNIVKLYRVGETAKVKDPYVGGSFTVIATLKDGSFYNLEKLISLY